MCARRRAWSRAARLLLAVAVGAPVAAHAQTPAEGGRASALASRTEPLAVAAEEGRLATAYHFRSEADSLEWERARTAAERSSGYRIVISLFDRRLAVVQDEDTLLATSVGVGMDSTLVHGERQWNFRTPRGVRRVLAKEANPVWVPPDWHYVEVAGQRGLRLERLRRGHSVELRDGRRLEVRGDEVGVVDFWGDFTPLPRDQEIIFDEVLYVPPFGTKNRMIEGELGAFRLKLGDGYLLHGTPHKGSIGEASTHGCIRLSDADIAWLHEHVPVGTRVYIY